MVEINENKIITSICEELRAYLRKKVKVKTKKVKVKEKRKVKKGKLRFINNIISSGEVSRFTVYPNKLFI